MKAFDELKKSHDSNFRYATPLSSYLAPKSLKITIYGSNCKESELEGHFLPKKAKKIVIQSWKMFPRWFFGPRMPLGTRLNNCRFGPKIFFILDFGGNDVRCV